jgi:2'-5' RNA ligase
VVPWDAPGSTAIVVLTPEAEALVGGFYREHSNAGRDEMTLHVTLLVPFVPADTITEGIEGRLRRLFSRFEAFDYALDRFEYFESGVLYLAPEPPEPFVAIVQALAREFPDYPPYEGVHDDVIPHVTIAESRDPQLLARIRSEIEPELPITCRAETATLVERGANLCWRPRTAYAFGSLE